MGDTYTKSPSRPLLVLYHHHQHHHHDNDDLRLASVRKIKGFTYFCSFWASGQSDAREVMATSDDATGSVVARAPVSDYVSDDMTVMLLF